MDPNAYSELAKKVDYADSESSNDDDNKVFKMTKSSRLDIMDLPDTVFKYRDKFSEFRQQLAKGDKNQEEDTAKVKTTNTTKNKKKTVDNKDVISKDIKH